MTNNKWFFHFRFLVSIKFLCEGPHLRCTPLHSPKWGLRPHSPHGEGAPPLRPRVTFPSRGKSPKARQGLPPFGIPWCVVAALFALAALRSVSRRATFYLQLGRIFHFEFVGKSAFVSPELYRGNTPSSQSVARQLVCGLRAARSFAPFWGEQRGALLGG